LRSTETLGIRSTNSTVFVGRTQRFRYDAAGRVLQRTGYTGEVTEYQYDGTGRLVGENAPAIVQASYHYHRDGNLVRREDTSGAPSWNWPGTPATCRSGSPCAAR